MLKILLDKNKKGREQRKGERMAKSGAAGTPRLLRRQISIACSRHTAKARQPLTCNKQGKPREALSHRAPATKYLHRPHKRPTLELHGEQKKNKANKSSLSTCAALPHHCHLDESNSAAGRPTSESIHPFPHSFFCRRDFYNVLKTVLVCIALKHC